MLGNRFPPGIFDWPPTEWLKSYDARKKRGAATREHASAPEGKRPRVDNPNDVPVQPATAASGRQPPSTRHGRGSSASSSSSSAVPPACPSLTPSGIKRPAGSLISAALAGWQPPNRRRRLDPKSQGQDTGRLATAAPQASAVKPQEAASTRKLTIAEKWAADNSEKL